jgi:hypothetical protein
MEREKEDNIPDNEIEEIWKHTRSGQRDGQGGVDKKGSEAETGWRGGFVRLEEEDQREKDERNKGSNDD